MADTTPAPDITGLVLAGVNALEKATTNPNVKSLEAGVAPAFAQGVQWVWASYLWPDIEKNATAASIVTIVLPLATALLQKLAPAPAPAPTA